MIHGFSHWLNCGIFFISWHILCLLEEKIPESKVHFFQCQFGIFRKMCSDISGGTFSRGRMYVMIPCHESAKRLKTKWMSLLQYGLPRPVLNIEMETTQVYYSYAFPPPLINYSCICNGDKHAYKSNSLPINTIQKTSSIFHFSQNTGKTSAQWNIIQF
jgi:hypothetical protein